MMRQYRNLKVRYPDHLLLFRLGDFYETFFEDAELAARLLQITLTARQGAPMAGIPHHAADGYIARLVHAGQKIAVCEQLEAPGPTKKLLRRGVVRIITPGTLTDTAYLEGAANNFLLAVAAGRGVIGVALVDVFAAPRRRRPLRPLPRGVARAVRCRGSDCGPRRRGGGSRVSPDNAGRRPRPSDAPDATDSRRCDGAGRDGRRDARAPGVEPGKRPRLALRRARRDRHPDGRTPPPPVASSPAPRSGRDRRAPGGGRRPGRGACGASESLSTAAADRRPRAADEPRDPRPGPRARPRGAARMPGAAPRDPTRRGGDLRGADRGGARGAGAAGRPPRLPGGGPRGRAAPRAPRRRADPRELARGARRDRPRRPGSAGVDRGARGTGAGADRHPEPSGALQSSVRLRYRGDARPCRARAR